MSKTKFTLLALLSAALALQVHAQTPPPAKPPAAPAAAQAPSRVDTVIQLLKGGMTEAFVIKQLQRENKPIQLTTPDMLKLQKAGVSEKIMDVMMDPGAAAAPANAAAPPAPAAAPQPAPAGPPAPVASTAGVSCGPPPQIARVVSSQKRRLAVSAFDYAAVRTSVTGIFGNDVNIGQGIRSMLSVKMGQSKTVVLLEREKIDAVIKEQIFGGTNRVKQGTKAKTGGITGADAMLFGDIVIFGRDDTTKKSAVGGVLGVFSPVGGAIANARQTNKAVVAITLRLVDAETGETLATEEARGESTRTSTNWGAIAGSFHGAAAATSSMTSANFAETIIGEATQDAVNKIAAILETKVPQIGAKTREVEGRVANIDGCNLILSVGGNDSVQVGDHFEIHQILSEVLDPDTKEVLDKQTVKVGDFVAGTVRDKVTIGQYGGQPLSATYAKGYAARLVQPVANQ